MTVADGTVFAPGAPINKVWKLRNAGSCSWQPGYQLSLVAGNQMNGSAAQSVSATAPGATAEIAVPMVAPSVPGRYSGVWQMVNAAGLPFGQKVTINIQVASPAATVPTSGPQTVPITPTVQLPVGQPALVNASALPGHLAFINFKPGMSKTTYDIYVSKLDGADRRLVWQWGRHPKFRRSDGRLALMGDEPGKDRLWTINMDGGDAKELSLRSEDAHPSWAPKGDRVLFDSQFYTWGAAKAERIWSIWIQDSADKPVEPRSVAVADRVIPGDSPVWLDNDWIVYRGCNFWAGGGSCGLYTAPSWGAPVARQLTTAPDDFPADALGDWILYTGRDRGNWDVYKVNFAGGPPTNLTNNPAADGLPTFSPDGSKIAFVSDRGGAWAIWVMNADGSNPFKAFDLPGGPAAMGPDWVSERITWGP